MNKVRCGEGGLVSIGNKPVCGRCGQRVSTPHLEDCAGMPVMKVEVGPKVYMMGEGGKHCGACDQWRPLTAFARNRGKRDGLQSRCTRCSIELARKHRAKHRRH